MENLGARIEKACPIGDRVRSWLTQIRTTIVGSRTAVLELIDDHASFKTAVDEGKTAVDDLIARQAEDKTAIDELIDDHASFKTVVDEITAWGEALATKLNLDTGVNDADYDAVIDADAPETLSASDPSVITASSPTAGPDTLSAGDPDAAPAALLTYI